MGARYIIQAVKKDDLVTLKKELVFFTTYICKDYDLNQVCCKKEKRLLHIAAKHGSSRVFLYLLEQGVNINITDAEGNTAAYYAILYLQPEILKILKEKGADFSIQNNNGYTLEQYIQIKLKKNKHKKIKKEFENIISETHQTPFHFKPETEEQEEVCSDKAQTSNLSLHLYRESTQIQTEPLNLVKHDRPLDLSITSCLKK